MLPKLNLMPDEELASKMIAVCSIFVLFVVVIFELFMPALAYPSDYMESGIAQSGDSSFNLIVYLLASSLHIAISLFFSAQLWSDIRRMSPIPRFVIKEIIVLLSMIILIICLLLACYFELKIVSYSHHRNIIVMNFASWDYVFQNQILDTSISWFSVYVLFGICCGILFSVVSCVWSSVKSMDLAENQIEKESFDKDLIWSEISMFGLIVTSVFVASTFATVFYLNLALGLTYAEGYGQYYRNGSDAMSILWGVCFSVITIVIVLFPIGRMNEVTRVAHKRSRVFGKDTGRFSFIYTTISVDRVLKIVAILIAPMYIASLRSFI